MALSTQIKFLINLFIAVLTFQVVHSMFNIYFPFLLEQLVGPEGKTLHIKSIFDAVRVVISVLVTPLLGAIADKYGRKVLLMGYVIEFF